MRITCEDQSEGRLFFAHDFLSTLNSIGQKVKLYVPDNYQTKYGNFLDYFPRIDIQLGFQNLNTTVPDIIFSNANDLHALQQIKKSLIFPILKNSEIKNYINWYNLLKDKFKQNIIPVEFKQSEKSIVQPESKWAMDMLQRQISEKPLKDISFLISAGPTIEDIDPVRYITNRSSGKMGIALARAAYLNGANVKLVIGPTSIDIPCYLKTQQIRSAEDMYHAVISHFEHCDVYIG
ncbi:MAG: phosphopantothenoylcysteine decarboxylase, partial [Calditrichaceae bacterium]